MCGCRCGGISNLLIRVADELVCVMHGGGWWAWLGMGMGWAGGWVGLVGMG